MVELLDNIDNLKILISLVSGECVSINYSELCKKLGKHRKTIQKRTERLFANNILEPPVFPFYGLFKVYPLLTLLNIDIPDCLECATAINRWIKEDPHILMAYRSRQGEYDSLLFTVHTNIEQNQLWMSQIPTILEDSYNVEKKHATFYSNAVYCSNKLIQKYDPGTGVNLMEMDFKENGSLSLQGLELEELDLDIMRLLSKGTGIKYNHQHLSKITGLNERTVSKRIEALFEAEIITPPVCMFPNWYIPPGYLFSYSFLKYDDNDEEKLDLILQDKNVSLAIQTIYRKFNLLIFSNHKTLGDKLRWEDNYHNYFPEIQTTYLSQEMAIGFNQKRVSLSYLESKLSLLSKKNEN